MSAAAALLQELGSGAGGRPRVGGDLTAREQEVLELIALGMSNARIARALVISEKTVGHHVSRILMKLGVSNRTEAAMLAPRDGRYDVAKWLRTCRSESFATTPRACCAGSRPGERLRITVHGHPIAELVPVDRAPEFVPFSVSWSPGFTA